MSSRWLKILALASGLVLAGILPYRSELGWIDPVTGSMKSQTRCFLVPTSTVVRTSALERWIIRHEGTYTSHWRFLHDTSSSVIYGRAHACGLGPEIYPLRAGGLDDDFVRHASDARIAEFVRIMRAGTPAARERVVESACQEALGDPKRGG
jgi:hypothetical protein